MAIPIWQGRVSPVLDVAARLLLVRYVRGRETERHEVLLARHTLDGLCGRLRGLGVDRVICAALSDSLEHGLRQEGIAVTAGVCGEVEVVLQACRAGRLTKPVMTVPGARTRPPGSPRGRKRPPSAPPLRKNRHPLRSTNNHV